MRKAGAKDYKSFKKILNVCNNKPISRYFDDFNSMINQGIEINNWGKNVYVKVPVVNSKTNYWKSYTRIKQKKYKTKY